MNSIRAAQTPSQKRWLDPTVKVGFVAVLASVAILLAAVGIATGLG